MEKYAVTLRKTREYRAVQSSDNLYRALRKYLGPGWRFYYPRQSRWARLSFPDRILPQTEPHQDGVYLGGGKDLYVIWIPLHDCSEQLGGLGLVPKTHVLGPLIHNDKTLPYSNSGRAWKKFSYRAGDVMLFHYDLIHGGSPNRTRDGIRLSIDFRVKYRLL
jgi:ectoine hydroxylase-related dioxygenase (phytanoyl-CoA dioxygenase family)